MNGRIQERERNQPQNSGEQKKRAGVFVKGHGFWLDRIQRAGEFNRREEGLVSERMWMDGDAKK
jgi:hypothetical protein